MKTITSIAIDDEPIALTIIEQFCQRHGGMELRTFSEPQVGLDEIQRTKPDIVFLDIKMTDVNGLQIARQLPHTSSFIFTTAYTEYALEGFNLEAADYLHKPFSYDRFCKAVERAIRQMEFLRNKEQMRSIVVKQEYANVLIPVAEIIYIEAMGNYVRIFREADVCTVSRMTLKSVVELLPVDEFISIHRSYVVAKNKIRGFSKHHIQLSSDVELPIGRIFADEVHKLLQSIDLTNVNSNSSQLTVTSR